MTGCTAGGHHGEGCCRCTYMGARTHMHPCEQSAHMAWRKARQLLQTIAFNMEKVLVGILEDCQTISSLLHVPFMDIFVVVLTPMTPFK